MSDDTNYTMRQFYVGKDIGLTISQAQAEFGVEIRILDLDVDESDENLIAGRLIAVEGNHNNVYRLFDVLCPGALNQQQKQQLYRQ